MSRSTRPLLLFVYSLGQVFEAQTSSQASLIALDAFDYGVAGHDLNNSGPGGSFGFSDLWTGNTSYNIADGSVEPPAPLPQSGNSVYGVAYPENRGINRTLSTILGDDNTSIYVSVVMRPEGILHQGAYEGWFGLALRGTTDVVIGMKYSQNQYGLRVAGLYANSSVDAVVGQSAFLVLRMDFAEGVDPAYVYVNPTPGAPEPAFADASIIDLGYSSLDIMSLTGPGGVTFDSIRVGTSYADVAPATADFDGNGMVDEGDLGRWQMGYGTQTNGLPSDGDANVDGVDFLDWQRQFGYQQPLPPTVSQVPEPATGMLLCGTLLVWLVGIARRVARPTFLCATWLRQFSFDHIPLQVKPGPQQPSSFVR